MKNKKRQEEILLFIREFDNSYENAILNAMGKYHLNRKIMRQILVESKFRLPTFLKRLKNP